MTREGYREDGTVDVAVTAVEPGPTGNVGAGVITIMMDPIAGVTIVNNADKITGGIGNDTLTFAQAADGGMTFGTDTANDNFWEVAA